LPRILRQTESKDLRLFSMNFRSASLHKLDIPGIGFIAPLEKVPL